MEADSSMSPRHGWIRPARGELKHVLLAALAFFGVMLWYFPLRSLRDALAAERDVRDLPWLFTATWLAMLAIQPPFGALIARWPRQRSIGAVFHATALCLALFYAFVPRGSGVAGQEVAVVFYVWLSVFNLFTISIAWAVFSDCFSHAQAKRVYGWVGLGGTLGAIAGSQVAELWTGNGREPLSLFLFSIVVLEATWPLFAWLLAHPLASAPRSNSAASIAAREPLSQRGLGGGALEGVRITFSHPILLAIALYMLTQTAASAFLYSTQQALVASEFTERAARTAWLARTERYGQIATLVAQLFLTGPVITHLGIGLALLVYPLGTLGLFAWMGFNPGLSAVFAARVGARGLDSACSRPAREALFTLASRVGRYKAKPFLDTFVYRSGDLVGAWLFRSGQAGLGLTLRSLAFAAMPLALLGALAALLLSRRVAEQERAEPRRSA